MRITCKSSVERALQACPMLQEACTSRATHAVPSGEESSVHPQPPQHRLILGSSGGTVFSPGRTVFCSTLQLPLGIPMLRMQLNPGSFLVKSDQLASVAAQESLREGKAPAATWSPGCLGSRHHGRAAEPPSRDSSRRREPGGIRAALLQGRTGAASPGKGVLLFSPSLRHALPCRPTKRGRSWAVLSARWQFAPSLAPFSKAALLAEREGSSSLRPKVTIERESVVMGVGGASPRPPPAKAPDLAWHGCVPILPGEGAWCSRLFPRLWPW